MAGRYRKAIVNPDGVFVFLNDSVGRQRAERAGHLAASMEGVLIMPSDQGSSAFLSRFSQLSAFPGRHRVSDAPEPNHSCSGLLLGGSVSRLLLIGQLMAEHACVPSIAALNQVKAKVQTANTNMANFPLILVGLVAPSGCLLVFHHGTQMIAGDLPEGLRSLRCVCPGKPHPYQDGQRSGYQSYRRPGCE